MAGKNYIWKRTRQAIDNLASDPSATAIRCALNDLTILETTGQVVAEFLDGNPDTSDQSAYEAWQALRALMRIEPERMTAENKSDLLRNLWVLHDHESR
jgi:hypothetical protein